MRSALITGGARGFGRALALELNGRGWDVTVVIRRHQEIGDGIGVLVGDVTEDRCAALVAEAFRDKPLDLLVNNAGIDAGSNIIGDIEPELILEMTAVHAAGAARMMRAGLPALRRAPAAQIVNISSRLGSLRHAADQRYAALEQSIAYRMAKAAQNMLTLAAAESLHGSDIAVCAVHPGRLRTAMAAPDADLDVDVAALRLADWLATGKVAGRFYDLDTESDLPW